MIEIKYGSTAVAVSLSSQGKSREFLVMEWIRGNGIGFKARLFLYHIEPRFFWLSGTVYCIMGS